MSITNGTVVAPVTLRECYTAVGRSVDTVGYDLGTLVEGDEINEYSYYRPAYSRSDMGRTKGGEKLYCGLLVPYVSLPFNPNYTAPGSSVPTGMWGGSYLMVNSDFATPLRNRWHRCKEAPFNLHDFRGYVHSTRTYSYGPVDVCDVMATVGADSTTVTVGVGLKMSPREAVLGGYRIGGGDIYPEPSKCYVGAIVYASAGGKRSAPLCAIYVTTTTLKAVIDSTAVGNYTNARFPTAALRDIDIDYNSAKEITVNKFVVNEPVSVVPFVAYNTGSAWIGLSLNTPKSSWTKAVVLGGVAVLPRPITLSSAACTVICHRGSGTNAMATVIINSMSLVFTGDAGAALTISDASLGAVASDFTFSEMYSTRYSSSSLGESTKTVTHFPEWTSSPTTSKPRFSILSSTLTSLGKKTLSVSFSVTYWRVTSTSEGYTTKTLSGTLTLPSEGNTSTCQLS